MSHQLAIFHDSLYDAIAADVNAIGGIKKTAALLWPAKEDAAAKLRACLSTAHAQKLDPEEYHAIKRLARSIGSFAILNYESQDLSYRYELISAEDRKTKLQEEFIATGQLMARLVEEMKKLK